MGLFYGDPHVGCRTKGNSCVLGAVRIVHPAPRTTVEVIKKKHPSPDNLESWISEDEVGQAMDTIITGRAPLL